MASETIEARGHLIDSGLLSAIFDKIIEHKASYEVLTFTIGRTNDDASHIRMRVTAPDKAVLAELIQQLTTFGAHLERERDALVKPAEKDRCVPDDFYSTTNHRTQVRVGGQWVDVDKQRMDAVIVVSGDKVLIGSYDSNLYALGAKDGKLVWKVQTEGYVHATPAVVDGVAYIAGCDEILRGIRISDGTEVLKMAFGAYTGASPAVIDGRAYYGTYENEVLAVDLKAKKIVWTYKHPERSFPFYSSPSVLGDRVIVGGRDKMVHALDKKTGKALWTFMTGARVDSSPVVSGGMAYIGSNDGKLYVLDVATGKSVFQFEAGGPLSASPAVASGRLVIGSQDGKLFCLG